MDILQKYIEKKEYEKDISVKIHALTFVLDRTQLQEAGMSLDRKVECIELGKPNFPPVVVLLLRNLILFKPTYFDPEDIKHFNHIRQLCQMWNITKIPWNPQLSIEDWLKQVILLPKRNIVWTKRDFVSPSHDIKRSISV